MGDRTSRGGGTEDGSDSLTLWNFDVDGGDLKPEHFATLNRMAERVKIAFLHAGVELEIEGHASRSGQERENDRLSITRANAVFNHLLDRGVDGERVRLGYFGSSRPLFPNITGGAMARNRRVELRILGMPGPEPLQPPPVPEPPTHRRAPEGPGLRLGERFPSGSIEFKKEFDPNYPIAMGPYVLCYPSVQISGKYRMKTMRGGTVALGFGEKGASVQFKQKLNQLTEFKVDSAGNAGFGFSGEIDGKELFFNAEIVWDWVKLVKGRPLVYSISKTFPSPDYEWPPNSGVKWEIEFEVKGKFSFGPSPAGVAALARLGLGLLGGATEAATGGEIVATGVAALGAPEVLALAGIVAAISFIPFTVHEVMGAQEEGERNARLFARHNGFALRIAGEVTDYRMAFKRLDAERGRYYEDRYDGWMDAEALLATADKSARERLRHLGARYGSAGVDPLVAEILRRTGAFSFKPLPSSIEDLTR